jgi:hypothetical protein
MGYHAVRAGMFYAVLADPPHLWAYSWNIFLSGFLGVFRRGSVPLVGVSFR